MTSQVQVPITVTRRKHNLNKLRCTVLARSNERTDKLTDERTN